MEQGTGAKIGWSEAPRLKHLVPPVVFGHAMEAANLPAF